MVKTDMLSTTINVDPSLSFTDEALKLHFQAADERDWKIRGIASVTFVSVLIKSLMTDMFRKQWQDKSGSQTRKVVTVLMKNKKTTTKRQHLQSK